MQLHVKTLDWILTTRKKFKKEEREKRKGERDKEEEREREEKGLRGGMGGKPISLSWRSYLLRRSWTSFDDNKEQKAVAATTTYLNRQRTKDHLHSKAQFTDIFWLLYLRGKLRHSQSRLYCELYHQKYFPYSFVQ